MPREIPSAPIMTPGSSRDIKDNFDINPPSYNSIFNKLAIPDSAPSKSSPHESDHLITIDNQSSNCKPNYFLNPAVINAILNILAAILIIIHGCNFFESYDDFDNKCYLYGKAKCIFPTLNNNNNNNFNYNYINNNNNFYNKFLNKKSHHNKIKKIDFQPFSDHICNSVKYLFVAFLLYIFLNIILFFYFLFKSDMYKNTRGILSFLMFIYSLISSFILEMGGRNWCNNAIQALNDCSIQASSCDSTQENYNLWNFYFNGQIFNPTSDYLYKYFKAKNFNWTITVIFLIIFIINTFLEYKNDNNETNAILKNIINFFSRRNNHNEYRRVS